MWTSSRERSVAKWVTNADGTGFAVPDDFDSASYGAAEGGFDPAAPFGSAASVPQGPPPDSGMSVAPQDAGMSVNPGPAPEPLSQASAPVQIEPVSVSGSARGSGYAPGADPEQNPIAFMQQGVAPSTPEQMRIADQMGYVWQGGRKAQQKVDPFWQNAQRSGQYDPAEQQDLLANASIDQQLANQGATDAALEQNRAAIEAARREQAVIERMQLEQGRKNAAMREQVDADRGEWERQRAAYEKDAGDGDSILGTPQGALQTIFGMLAIGLAARGSRENLDSTINAVNGNIDRLVQQQRANVKAKGDMADNAYARYLRAYGNEEQAQAATRALMLDKAAKQVELTSLRSRDPAIAAQGQKAAADIRSRLAEQMAIIAQESQGKVTQGWNVGQEARAGSGGGYRAMTAAEQDKRDERIQDVSGKVLGNQGKAIDNQKALVEAQSGVSPAEAEGLNKNKDALEQLAAANSGLAKLRALKDKITASGDKNFAGMSDDSVTPFTASAGTAINRLFSNDAVREQSEFNDAIGDVMFARYGAGNKEQKADARSEILVDDTKEGTMIAIDKLIANAEQRAKEIRSTVDSGTIEAYDRRRKQEGASQATVAQPGRAL